MCRAYAVHQKQINFNMTERLCLETSILDLKLLKTTKKLLQILLERMELILK